MSSALALVLAFVGGLVVTVLLLRTPVLAATAPGDTPAAAVTVIVPARDEATNLPGLLDSLHTGDVRPAEVIVVDDDSSDGTGAVAEAHGATVVRPGPPPPGWAGKPWACEAGAAAAAHRRLVFVDADVRFAAGGLAAVLAAHDVADGLLSVQPRHDPGGRVEQLSAVFNVCAVAGSGGGPPGAARVAFGPCVVVERATYARLGGHAAVAASIVEDLDLGRIARSCGVGVTALRGGRLVRFRMYPGGWRPLVQGWTKNIARGAGGAPPWAVAATVLWVAGLAAVATASLLGVVHWATGGPFPWVPVAGYAAVAAHTAWAFARVGHFRTITAITYPVALAVFLGVFACSVVAVVTRRPVRWRNRRVVHASPTIERRSRR